MSACCVPGCTNRYSATGTLRFYKIPSGNRPFQANRRRLWLRAIRGAIGSSGDIKSSARICGAHFVSGEASLDHDSPDFVPSVFESNKPKKRVKRPYRHRRRRRHRATGKTAPPEDDSSVDLQLFAYLESESELLDATETTSDPSLTKEEEPLTKSDEATLSTKNVSLSPYTNKLDTTSPVVLLKSVVSPEGGFQCELCTQICISVSELLKHKEEHAKKNQTYICEICGQHLIGQSNFAEHQRLHVEEPFPCNVCHRSFTTSHNLKRHKLLHVKDGRKCPVCGVLFCRRHNHVLFLPRHDSVSESEQDCSSIEPQNLNSDSMSESRQVEKRVSSEAPPPEKPVLKTIFSLPRPPPSEIPGLKTIFSSPRPPPSEIPVLKTIFSSPRPPPPEIPVLKTIFSSPRPPLPVLKYPRPSSLRNAALSSQDAAFTQPPPPKHSDLPASLHVFSPLYLTSAALEVKRNYEYILNKPIKVKKEIVKEEDVEEPLFPLHEHSVRQVRKQRIAYDMEIVL